MRLPRTPTGDSRLPGLHPDVDLAAARQAHVPRFRVGDAEVEQPWLSALQDLLGDLDHRALDAAAGHRADDRAALADGHLRPGRHRGRSVHRNHRRHRDPLAPRCPLRDVLEDLSHSSLVVRVERPRRARAPSSARTPRRTRLPAALRQGRAQRLLRPRRPCSIRLRRPSGEWSPERFALSLVPRRRSYADAAPPRESSYDALNAPSACVTTVPGAVVKRRGRTGRSPATSRARPAGARSCAARPAAGPPEAPRRRGPAAAARPGAAPAPPPAGGV